MDSTFHGDTPQGPRIGLGLAQVGPFADPATVIEMASTAEALGYASLWAMDRLLTPLAPRTPYPASPDGVLPGEQGIVLDPIVALTLAATATTRIGLGTSVLVAPWYPPVLLARSLTAVDRASAGRLTVGLGLGWSVDEYDAVGGSQRGLARQSEEILDVLDTVWGDDVVAHRGERFHIAASSILPKPVQRPLLAAYTPAGLDRVARRADGWTPAGLPVEAVAPMFAAVRDLAASHGRDPDALELVVRANIKLTTTPLGPDRPAYWGAIEQIADDLERTRSAGADEIILELQGCARTLDELFEVAAAISAPVLTSV
jgi:probable F420-dependent oxidoreductase